MAKAELGDKQTCPSCGAKFYDLKRRPAVCPKCSFSFDPSEEVFKVKRARVRAAPVQADYEDEEDEEEADAKVTADDDSEELEEEAEVTPDLDEAVAEDAPELIDEEDESEPVVGVRAKGDEIPEGFSEDDEDVIADDEDDGVPLLEDDEAFDEDELDDVVEGDSDEEADR